MVRFLDNLITLNRYPIPEIDEEVKKGRKIGLGIMGWAECLVKLGIPYASNRAIELGREVMQVITEAARQASFELAEERGPFPAIEDSIWATSKKKPRNATCTTIAPTGTISRVFEVSQGIEPLFALVYEKNVVSSGEKLYYYNEDLLRRLEIEGLTDEQIAKVKATLEDPDIASIQGLDFVPGYIKDLFKTSTEIAPEWHIRMQAAFQEFTDNAVSKTVNGPNNWTVEDVKDIYWTAWEYGLKGITVYRTGSRGFEPMKAGIGGSNVSTVDDPVVVPDTRKRGEVLPGLTYRMPTGCGNIYITINNDDYGPAEIFCRLGKAGGCASAQMESLGRLTSKALRKGVTPEEVIDMLKGIRCHITAFSDKGPVYSCADAIAQVLEAATGSGKMPEGAEIVKEVKSQSAVYGGAGACPECGSALRNEGGCIACSNISCGFSKCG